MGALGCGKHSTPASLACTFLGVVLHLGCGVSRLRRNKKSLRVMGMVLMQPSARWGGCLNFRLVAPKEELARRIPKWPHESPRAVISRAYVRCVLRLLTKKSSRHRC